MKKGLFIVLLLLAGSNAVRAQVCPVFITHLINGNQVSYFGSSPSNPTAWSWFFNGGTPLTSSQQNPVVTYANPGTYICALSVSGGPNSCSAALSNKQDTVTIASTGIGENVKSDEVKILQQDGFPVCLISSTKTRSGVVRLIDINGHFVAEVFKGSIQEGNNILQIQSAGLAAGTYLLSIEMEDIVKVIKFSWKG